MEAADVEIPGPRLRMVDDTAPPTAASRDALVGLITVLGSCVDACDGSVHLAALRYEEQIEAVDSGEHWQATRSARIVTTWVLRHADGNEIERLTDVGTVDRWTAEGANESAARSSLLPPNEIAGDLAHSTGVAYARHLLSRSWTFTRTYYAAGPLRLGALALKDGDLRAARGAWNAVVREGVRPALVARAHHDLAVVYEIEGAPALSRQHLDVAMALGAPSRTHRYADLLEQTRGATRALRQFEPTAGDPAR